VANFLVYEEYADYGLPFENFVILDFVDAPDIEQAYKTFIKKSGKVNPNVHIVPVG
jgi:hypothetical protein